MEDKPKPVFFVHILGDQLQILKNLAISLKHHNRISFRLDVNLV